MKNLIIIDTFGFFFRLYYAMPNLKSKDGNASGMISGFANFIYNLERDYDGDYVIFALDSKGKSFRSQIDENYKINRKEAPEKLKEQLPICIEMLERMGFYSLSVENYEADDIIASAVKQFKDDKLFIKIVTSDKDLYQLIDENVNILSPITKELHDEKACLEKFGVLPKQVRDFLAICGDVSDNIPGIKGIGPVGARKLLKKFGTLENIYENIEQVRDARTKTILKDSKDMAFLSQKLASLYEDLELPNLDFAIFPKNPLLKVKDILQNYSISALLKKLIKEEEEKDSEEVKVLRTKEDFAKVLRENEKVYFYLQADNKDLRKAQLENLTFAYDKNLNFRINLNEELMTVFSKDELSLFLNRLFNKNFLIIHDLKFTLELLEKNSIFVTLEKDNFFDIEIFYYLYNSDLPLALDALYKGESEINSRKVLELYEEILEKKEDKIIALLTSIDFPLVRILLEMQREGIKVNIKEMQKNAKALTFALDELKNEIFVLTGQNFNLRSPKQLSKVLFEDLGLPAKKKTKTGFSTDESVLNDLLDEHEVIEKILAFREREKLLSTYYEPLIIFALKDNKHRIHTTFLQTKTATTRLASIYPNLQNIPLHSALAKDLRTCFIAKDAFSLLSLDYSQIELRVLAHFTQDEILTQAFLNDEDIHAQTAFKLFGEVNKEKRALAKTINFGILYGMGQVKLAKSLRISNKEAKAYIDNYFKSFPTVKNYLFNLEEKILKEGFVSTLFGRKRYFDFKNASPVERATYIREGINSQFQASAAEIIKKAMVEIAKLCDRDKIMLLQIHDELIFEVKDNLIETFTAQVKNIMENIVQLRIPLKVSSQSAKNLGELK